MTLDIGSDALRHSMSFGQRISVIEVPSDSSLYPDVVDWDQKSIVRNSFTPPIRQTMCTETSETARESSKSLRPIRYLFANRP